MIYKTLNPSNLESQRVRLATNKFNGPTCSALKTKFESNSDAVTFNESFTFLHIIVN